MTHQNEITVSEIAIRQARQCGFYNDTEARVRGIAASSAPTPHSSGNASYGPFVLLMRGNHVLSFTMIGPQMVDERPVSACKICRGLMTIPVRTVMDGQDGVSQRPCPRAFDGAKPICDTTRSKTND
jgi:hypothetical protein